MGVDGGTHKIGQNLITTNKKTKTKKQNDHFLAEKNKVFLSPNS